MKVHSGVDAGSGYVHTSTRTAANVHDIDETSKLIRKDDEVVYGDSGYSGAGQGFLQGISAPIFRDSHEEMGI